ncbi:MAG: dihydrofolate reductase [Desulfamplus sp.]|nr:dihydrofolate reductase [Desulfamplus sp.]
MENLKNNRAVKVILIMAMTLDGKIARHSMEPVDWTGSADKKKFVEITKKAGAVIMGSTTFETIGKHLKDRKNIVMTRFPSRMLKKISGDKSIDFNAIEFTDKTPSQILSSLQIEGFDSVALIGGSTINTLFALENLIDEIYITLVPKLFGSGLPLLSGELDINLELAQVDKLDNNSILLKYNVIK